MQGTLPQGGGSGLQERGHFAKCCMVGKMRRAPRAGHTPTGGGADLWERGYLANRGLHQYVGFITIALQPFLAVGGAFFSEQHIHQFVGVVLIFNAQAH